MSASGDGGQPTAQLGEPLDGRPAPPDPPCAGRQALFFSGVAEDVELAKSICRRTCHFRDRCLSIALRMETPVFGVWGGYGERELRLLRAGYVERDGRFEPP